MVLVESEVWMEGLVFFKNDELIWLVVLFFRDSIKKNEDYER